MSLFPLSWAKSNYVLLWLFNVLNRDYISLIIVMYICLGYKNNWVTRKQTNIHTHKQNYITIIRRRTNKVGFKNSNLQCYISLHLICILSIRFTSKNLIIIIKTTIYYISKYDFKTNECCDLNFVYFKVASSCTIIL